MSVTILNTSILTTHGSFTYKSCSLELAKDLVKLGFQSAIGHESTAAVITTLLGVEVKINRIQYKQEPGDTALVFKLSGRPPEGVILTAEEIEKIGYAWGIIEMTEEEKQAVPLGECFSCSYAGAINPDGSCPYCGDEMFR